MDRQEQKEIIALMNRHKSTQRIELDVVAVWAEAISVIANANVSREHKVQEIALLQLGAQQLIEHYNCEAEVENVVQRILEGRKVVQKGQSIWE